MFSFEVENSKVHGLERKQACKITLNISKVLSIITAFNFTYPDKRKVRRWKMIIKKYLFETHSSGAIESHVTIKTKDRTHCVKQRTDNSLSCNGYRK